MKIISVFHNVVFLRSLIISMILIIINKNLVVDIVTIILFLLFNVFLLFLNWFSKPEKKIDFYIKNILRVQ